MFVENSMTFISFDTKSDLNHTFHLILSQAIKMCMLLAQFHIFGIKQLCHSHVNWAHEDT